MFSLTQSQVATAFENACLAELDAIKPGNVGRHGDGHRMQCIDFEKSAAAASEWIAQSDASVGQRIVNAVEATMLAVGQNTNLGIILLCAPLAHAAQAKSSSATLTERTLQTLESLTVADTTDTFAAIVRASPAGLGRASNHDVNEPATVKLREAMIQAARRDRIAFQYAENFIDVSTAAKRIHDAPAAADSSHRWLISRIYLEFLSTFDDSHIVRKHGNNVASRVRLEALELHKAVCTYLADDGLNEGELISLLLSADTRWKQEGVNPGTSADLTVATVFFNFLINCRDN